MSCFGRGLHSLKALVLYYFFLQVIEGEITPQATMDGRKRCQNALLKHHQENPYKKTYQFSRHRKRRSANEHDDGPSPTEQQKSEKDCKDKQQILEDDNKLSQKRTDKPQFLKRHKNQSFDTKRQKTGVHNDILSKLPDNWNPVVKVNKLPEEFVQLFQDTPPVKTSHAKQQKILKLQVKYQI